MRYYAAACDHSYTCTSKLSSSNIDLCIPFFCLFPLLVCLSGLYDRHHIARLLFCCSMSEQSVDQTSTIRLQAALVSARGAIASAEIALASSPRLSSASSIGNPAQVNLPRSIVPSGNSAILQAARNTGLLGHSTSRPTPALDRYLASYQTPAESRAPRRTETMAESKASTPAVNTSFKLPLYLHHSYFAPNIIAGTPPREERDKHWFRLPTRWDTKRCCERLEMTANGLTVSFRGPFR